MSIFALTLAFSIPVFSPRVFAAEATSEAQLNALAESLQKKDENTYTGKLGSTTITFVKKTSTSPAGIPSPVTVFEAQNLACGGEKATVNINPAATVRTASLNAKFKSGSGCSEKLTISLNLSETGEIEGVADETTAPADDCEATDSGPLGWILCPVIDLGATFTSYVFKNFVQPFLEDVPISTNPDDGAYLAWKQFRLIGNIVLVGTMIAVVYAQARGSR